MNKLEANPQEGPILALVGSGLPQPLLAPEKNPGWAHVRKGYEKARAILEASPIERLVVYSTMWPSVIGHQIQARANLEWVHVDELFHDLGSIPYTLVGDPEFAHRLAALGKSRGLETRTVDYHGFPVDTGTVTATRLLDPDNRLKTVVLSSNVYADRAETVVLGKTVRQAIAEDGIPTAVVVVMSLSNRLFTDWIDPAEDRIHSPKDEEWNRKLLEFFAAGRVEDLSQLSREIHKQIRVKKVVNFKPLWWLAAVTGQSNRFRGEVHAYAPVYGTGAAVLSLHPTPDGIGEKEFDEDDVEVFRGDRSVLGGVASASPKQGGAKVPVSEGSGETLEASPPPEPSGELPPVPFEAAPVSDIGPGRPGWTAYPSSPLGESIPGIPTGRDVEWEPLVDYRRNEVSETTIHGAVAWASGGKVLHSFGGNVLCYGRSMMKPLWMKVFAKELDPLFSWEQKAIAVASHNGDTEHVAAAQSILGPSEWGLMKTPLDVPLVQFGRQVRRARRWYHCCSGEHAAILRGLKLKGWDRVGYTLPDHPQALAFLEILRETLGEDWNPLRVARDGCGLPTFSNTVSELAILYAEMARKRDEDWVWEAMMRHPDLIGGFNRLDSTILKAGQGRVLAKEGADGLLGLSLIHEDYPDGLGIVIKIAHGWNAQATWYIARSILGSLGIQLRNPYPLHRQKAFVVPGIVPEDRLDALEAIPTWDEWDPNTDRWFYSPELS